jgi:uncharacterized lipoprotein YajG
MKRNTRLLIPLLAILLIAGCAGQKPAQTLPTGATSAADAQSYRVLNDAHAFLQSIRDSVAAGKLTLTATQKTTFNSLVAASNAADSLWETCHAGGCTATQQSQLTTQTNQLNASLATAQSQIVVAK